jgi:hypothetical protein
MQHVQKLDTRTGQAPSLAPMRVLTVQPSVWRRFRAWARIFPSQETMAEVTLTAVTILLMVWLFVNFSQALQQYTIIPLP